MESDPKFRRRQVPSFVPDDVKDPLPPADAGTSPRDDTAAPDHTGAAGNPPKTPSAFLLPDLSAYDLTVGEALELFTQARRRRPSDRTLQRYCQDGRFDCYKLKTTRNGTPVHEWIINSASLLAFIRTKPEVDDASNLATPDTDGDASTHTKIDKQPYLLPSVSATPNATGDANSNPGLPRSVEETPDDPATPGNDGDATESVVSRVELLIENARLTARLDAQTDLIGELRQDKSFMREQITHQRKNDTLMADMHRETLHTLKAVSVAGRHTRIEMPDPGRDDQRGSAFYDVRDNEQPPPEEPADGV